ncbi:hypothetical protein RI367_003185 [Sorochytrium milnesiophthora]
MATKDGNSLMAAGRKAITKPSFGLFWKPDWEAAAQSFEAAGAAFKTSKDNSSAVSAYTECADAWQKTNSNYMAAKAMEQGAACAVAMQDVNKAHSMYVRTSELFVLNGSADRAAEILDKGAKSIEQMNPDKAIELYSESCALYEQEDRHRFAADTFKRGINICLKSRRFTPAIDLSQRLIEAYIKMSNRNGASKSVLTLIVVHLANGDEVAASKVFEQYVGEQQLFGDELHLASDLLDAFAQGDAELLDKTVKKQGMTFLENEVVRLARSLRVEEGSGTGGGSVSAATATSQGQMDAARAQLFGSNPQTDSAAPPSSATGPPAPIPGFTPQPVTAQATPMPSQYAPSIAPSYMSDRTVVAAPAPAPLPAPVHAIPGFTPLPVAGSAGGDKSQAAHGDDDEDGFC